ncbi:MAG: Spo0E family sporulation regulatory protein-aspartic acid phosphatase [Lachnospiraceae bacterium]|nr:Spo0E family sporulation regulatory protein-aspartic acid phosphatase [Lachnospiraceae bacterium]
MEYLQELQSEIEKVRNELNVAAEQNVRNGDCYQTSVRLDKLIEDYMQYTKDKVHFRNCG